MENKHLKEMINFLNKRLESSEAKETTAITERACIMATITSTQKLIRTCKRNRKRKGF